MLDGELTWNELRGRLDLLVQEADTADVMVTLSAEATDGLRFLCFNFLAISAAEVFDLARRLADEARKSAGELPW